ncbi:potassium channel family protein [Acholeplasma granularum]|uniref:potassium channel family protein n=1 Tax=Acholeplasma granularum TaxID=264635 RepID=UPI0004B4C55C|nr:TrkA family potassium uptake protein [Acholeplasma granularum]
MKIIVCGGKFDAEYIVGKFLEDKHKVIVINPDEEAAKYISEHHRIPVLVADPTKLYTFEDAGAKDADVVVALSENDIDNYITCITAQKFFNVKKTICRVLNPKRVEIFKKLGVDTVISSIYMLGQTIKKEANLKAVFNTLSMENDLITITEIDIIPEYHLHGKKILNLNLPPRINISCIMRNTQVIIPNGQTEIKINDKLVMVSATSDQKLIHDFIEKSSKDKK